MLRVHSFETFGTHEGPGLRLVVFLQGCNFRCSYCHNPDTQDLRGGYNMAFKKIVAMAKDQENYFGIEGGITVSGGEPLLQAKKLKDFFKSLKKRKIHTVLDTNGSILNDQVKELLKYTDLVLLDVKHIDSALHEKITGVGNETVLAFADYLRQIGKPFWLRYVWVPELTNQDKYLKLLGERFKDFENIERLEILPYHNLGIYKYEALDRQYKLGHVQLPDKKEVDKAKKMMQKYFAEVHIR